MSFSWETMMKSRYYHGLSPLLYLSYTTRSTVMILHLFVKLTHVHFPPREYVNSVKGGTITILFMTQFTQTQALNRLSNHLNHTFDRRTRKNKFEVSLNILFQRILTSELRHNLLFKDAIKKKNTTS